MRISRPCYDKAHRCPGWAGGGMRYAEVQRCAGGHVGGGRLYDRPLWRFRFHRCDVCDVVVLPYVVRYVDVTYYRFLLRYRLGGRR